MRNLATGMLGLLLLAMPARGQVAVPDGAIVLFAPGSAQVTHAARDVVLAFLRPPRPQGFRGHCLRGHADRGPGAEALAMARARAIAAVMARQGVDRADVVLESVGDRAPVRLAPAGRSEPMNDRVELRPCPGPRLAGVAEAEARALDAALLPAFVTAIAPLIARAMGCAVPEIARQALEAPPLRCPAAIPPSAVPVISVLRVAGTAHVAVVLEWPVGIDPGEPWRHASAAAEAVLDMFGLPVGPVLAALAAEPGAGERVALTAGSLRVEVGAGPGLLRRMRIVPSAGEPP